MDHPFWSHLAFSTFQHRLASFNLPKIPIFVLARPVSAFPGRQSRSFPVFTRKIPAMALRAFHLQNTTRFIAQTRRYFHGLHIHHSLASSLPIFASTQPGAVSTLQHHTTLLTIFCWYLPDSCHWDRDNLFIFLRSPIRLQFSLVSFVCHQLPKTFRIS